MELELIKEDHEAVIKFLEKMFYSNKEDVYGFWKDYLKHDLKVALSRKILIAGPSRILGMGVITELEKSNTLDNYWEEYTPIRSLKIKREIITNSDFYFNGYFFCYMFLDFLYEMFGNNKDLFEFKLMTNEKGDSALMLKWYGEYCFACAEMKNPNFIFEKGGVTYIEKEFTDDEVWVEKKKHFSKIKNGLAEFELSYGSRRWKYYLITKDYLFEEIEETGGIMDV